MTISTASALSVTSIRHDGAGFVQNVRDGCGRGYHPNRWGRCVPSDDRYRSGPTIRLGGGGIRIDDGRRYQRPGDDYSVPRPRPQPRYNRDYEDDGN
ncbi:GCG_CRPN prefix-to-repeats domain-containing protein [Labrys sp. KNU-23]|uniref:GCG_CRPN prefix-to-repeats domain-containing protein n=1 Tax=Labrys sp. KNU-23 TaxID=2789216 RepID=UPI00352A094F